MLLLVGGLKWRAYMEREKMDRRVRYTKAQLREALVKLLQTQHISKISVKALCDAADVNRSTFYVHYANPYDLLDQIETEILGNLRAYLDRREVDCAPISEQNLTGILEYAKPNADLFTVLLSENCGPAFQIRLAEMVRLLPVPSGMDERRKAYIAAFAFDGCISVLHQWLREGLVESSKEMSEFLMDILHNGLSRYWRAQEESRP